MDTEAYRTPLAIHLVWNCADAHLVEPVIGRLCGLLSRDVKNPFSHGVNIPFFVYKSDNARETPPVIREVNARKNLCFFFTSEETAGRTNWSSYAQALLDKHDLRLVPVALNSNGLSLFKSINAIRYEDGKENLREDRCLICILHEVFRYGFVDIDVTKIGKESSLRVFISHSKGDSGKGVEMAQRLRSVISNTNMNSFFDATEIAPGMRFEDEISGHINAPRYAFVSIQTDGYSSRYWCQREILAAKKRDLPIVVVNYVSNGEDRSLPALSNTPVIRIDDTNDRTVLKILARMLSESIRCIYTKTLLAEYKRVGWIPENSEILIRPPESSIAHKIKARSAREFCYPEPPLFSIELNWLKDLGVEAYTPLQYNGNGVTDNLINGRMVGISISDTGSDQFNMRCETNTLKAFAQEVARYVLSKSGKLIYGGDLRVDGFTEFIISEAMALQNRIAKNEPKIIDYLAWPIHLLCYKDILILRSQHKDVLEIKEMAPASDIISDIDIEVPVTPSTPSNRYVLSRCLTIMRETSIGESFARICAGGKLSGYQGKMPGLLEEILVTIRHADKPLYLCGGFGGVVGEVCNALIDGRIPESLTEDWQITHNAGYKDLQAFAALKGNAADYDDMEATLCNPTMLKSLALRSGLIDSEYMRLMQSPFVDECVHLILKGMVEICKERKESCNRCRG